MAIVTNMPGAVARTSIWTMPSVGAEVLENYERMAEPAERQPKGNPPTR